MKTLIKFVAVGLVTTASGAWAGNVEEAHRYSDGLTPPTPASHPQGAGIMSGELVSQRVDVRQVQDLGGDCVWLGNREMQIKQLGGSWIPGVGAHAEQLDDLGGYAWVGSQADEVEELGGYAWTGNQSEIKELGGDM
jgi:hypothetical protein